MEDASPNVCPACLGHFTVQYYQRRAADEAPDKVEFCPNCPLDARQLKLEVIEPEYISPPTNVRPRSAKRNSSIAPDILAKTGTRTCLVVEGSAANRCIQMAVKDNLPRYTTTSITIPVIRNTGKGLTDFYTQSIVGGEAHIVSTSSCIAPYVYLQSLDVYRLRRLEKPAYPEYLTGSEIDLTPIGESEYTFLRVSDKGNKAKLYIMLPETNEDVNENTDKVLDILGEVLSTYGTETSIKSFMSASMVSSLYTQSAKAYDWPSAPSQGYSYTWKPDGERFWYVRYGSIWLFSRRLLSGSISGWTIEDKVRMATRAGPVLDVEVMIGHDPILIDVLALDNGVCTPPTRSLRYMLDSFYGMEDIGIPIYVREYFSNESDVYKTKDTLTYPVDGVVGIQDGSMTIIKLKTTKSIELQLDSTGDLLSAEGRVVASSELQKLYDPDSIIELRITKERNLKRPKVDEVILRTDKTKANSYEVCKSILHTMSDMPETLDRRRALVWCNTVRNKLHRIASAPSDRGRVVLDIGAGDGQEVSDYSDDLGVSYLLLEPDARKCKSLLRRLQSKGRCKLFDGAQHFSHVIASLTTGNLRYGIVQATLSDILMQEHAIKILRGCTRCCIASFSISHVSDDLRKLAILDIDIVGCGYLYDNVDSQGYLINRSGVSMRRETETQSSVRWGSDKVYMERAVLKRDFEDVFYVKVATELVPVFRSENTGLLSSVSTNLYVISTKKHI